MRLSHNSSWLTLLAGGCAAVLWIAPRPLADLPELKWAGLVLSLATVAGVIAGITSVRRACKQLIKLSTCESPARWNVPETDKSLFASTIEKIISTASRAVNEAQLRARELEIELKISNAERQHAQAIIHGISDAVLVTDSFDELVLANHSAARTFDFDLNRSSRCPVDKLLKDLRMIELIREMRQSDSRNGRRIVEHAIHTSDGDRAYKITLSSVKDGEAPAGVVAVLHDTTREKELAEMKNDFVSMVSHELRTPLASIKAYTEMLIDGEATDAQTQQEFHEVIQSEANRLGRLIDNILNISRIESGLVRAEKQPQSLTVVLKDAIEVIEPQAKQKKISIAERLTPVFYQTLGDRDMLYQAALNLLSNAIKYTPVGGSIAVETTVNEAHRKVLAKIIDTGVGIGPKDLPFVFDKFYRAQSNSRMAPGTGLGLALVKHIIETVHGGRVLVESELGKGSMFGFELELAD